MKTTLTVKRVAHGYKIKESDVIDLIEKGHLLAQKNADESYSIDLNSYQNMGKSMPSFLTEKIIKHMWEVTTEHSQSVREEVRNRFVENTNIYLDRSVKCIELLKNLHSKYEKTLNFKTMKNGTTAGFIVYARIISMLYSILLLLRKGVPSEAAILFRPLWEAILLSSYFTASEKNGSNTTTIKKWFNKNQQVNMKEVRDYVSNETGIPIESLRKLNNGYSSILHHTHDSIMAAYRIQRMNGFGHKFEEKLGFDYHETTQGRDLVALVDAFENLINPALSFFKISFLNTLPLTSEEAKLIDQEIDYLSKTYEERMSLNFK